MAKLTLLQIVQRMLDATDSDNVTDISDTPESEQAAQLVRTVYEGIVADFPWYHKRTSVQLEVTPTANLMKLPSAVEQLLSDLIYYDGERVNYINPEAMRDKLARRDKTASNVDSAGAFNDQDPRYWSTYDDEYIVFDAYDGNLVQALTDVWAAVSVSSPQANTDIPDLPHNLNHALLLGCLEEAFRVFKGDEIAARSYGAKFKRAISTAKLYAKRSGQQQDPARKVNYGRPTTQSSNYEIPTRDVVEG